MPISQPAIGAVLAKTKPPVCEILRVDWSASVTRYYASRKYNELPPFHRIGFTVEPRLIYPDLNDPFSQFEINPDLRTENIPFVFNDLDKEITRKFKDYGSGVQCEIFWYYPNNDDPSLDILTSMWFGQLKAPDVYGWKQIRTSASNGHRSREAFLPGSPRPKECRFTFGGHLPTAAAIRTNGCPYDRHVGGTTGLLNGAVPFESCPRIDATDCSTRFGHSRFFGGYNTDASSTVSDQNSGYVAVSKGNASYLKLPVPVVFGHKYVRMPNLLLWRRELNAGNPNFGAFASVWEVCEGPVRNVRDPKINEKFIANEHFDPRYGTRGQAPVSNYNAGGTISNFSSVAHFSARYSPVDPLTLDPRSMQASCRVDGLRDVAVYNDTEPGNGIVGTYYEGTTFSGDPVGVRIDHVIDFPQMFDPPFEGLPNHNWSVQWEGYITFPLSGNWTISGTHDDGMYVEIDGNIIFDELTNNGTHSGVFTATADNPYHITVKFIQETFYWFVNLKWEHASHPQEVVPHSALTHDGSSGFVRQWTDDRVWCLLECHTNQKWGMRYGPARFNSALADWIDASKWGLQTVDLEITHPDGETKNYASRRTVLGAVLEGRPAVDQITDIARSGGLSVPFQHEGAYTIIPFRKATADELTDARVFTDTGEARNIVWADGAPHINFSQIPDDRLINEIKLTFEADDNFDLERPITVDDPDQQLLAGRVLGDDNLQKVPSHFAAFGIRLRDEAIRLGYRLLWFGESDEGGTKNNLKGVFFTPKEQVLGLKRYQFIKIESALLNEFEFPGGDPIEYFRVLNLKAVGNGLVQVVCQAYNHEQYELFDNVTDASPRPPGNETETTAPRGNFEELTISSATYDADKGSFVVSVT